MKITKKVSVEIDELVSIKCDKCEKVYDDTYEMQEFHYINFVGGYSSIFGDGARIRCDICQHCLRTMLHGSYREYYE
jgi:hypothetical protein